MGSLQEPFEAALDRLRRASTDLQDVEAKAAAGGLPRSAVETVSAFANAEGGLLILGLDEVDGFRPVEVDASKLAADLASACADQMEPPIRPEIDVVAIDEHPVVIAVIDPLPIERKPCFVKARGIERGSFLRTHDGDRALTTYEVHVLRSSQGQPQDDTMPVPEATLADLDPGLLSRLLRRLRDTRGPVFATATDDDILRMMGVVIATDKGPAITLGGLLALGRYPQQHFPQLDITFVAYPTTTGEPLQDGTRFTDNQSIDGPIPAMVAGALAAMRRNMKRRSVVVGLGREDTWEYPEEAVREVIANALMHRDYHPLARGAQVRVELYPDRLEVSSPGGLYGPVAREDLLAESVSSSRNAVLAKLLEDVEVPDTGRTVCENRGTGLLVAAAALRNAGIEPPLLVDTVREFRVLIRNHGLLDEEALAWLANVDTTGLHDRQRLGLAFARRHSPITNQQYRTLTGCDALTATRDLTGMAGLGLLEKSRDRRWARWHLAGANRDDGQTPLPFGNEGTASPRRDRRPDLLRLLVGGPRSSRELAASLGMTKEGVLKWLRRMEADGEVTTTGSRRKSRANKWRLEPGRGERR
ncbi:MAG TPA: ATP-binding protein [Acidimicrobiia bacterium]|nr:ATP-binding protein [Acidimicrobiia bacterium]